ncbi:DHA2 family efflux MFS transporter permease subunit [Clostridium tyrobutyricum]|uniref:DHA2 family efflux MFS transporter permease subunit n=1 Tax=Clostridium tyrobutyricum TaxID=1519 RepID=UPI001C38F848|nr:DHA2 family efflux MFS transporter permease subunit [Clostridium tyrobutyricum]MBV4417396.1 DHA2 family efflux MFS transporter permease subunit [Clostridium tyrobutyricum]
MNKTQKVLAGISIVIACFLTVLDTTIVNVSMPSMASYFKTNITGVSWVSTAYLIAFSSLLINFSKIADIYGRKKLFLIGLVVFCTASICCGLSNSLTMLVVFRIIQGVGAAILTPLSIPLGIDVFGKNAMGKLAILVGMVISISAASGPVIGGLLNEAFNFRAIFYINVPFVIIALIFGFKFLNESCDETLEKKFDMLGTVLLVYGLAALTFFLSKGNAYGWGSVKIVTLIVTSILSILAFLIYESKIQNPIIEFKLFKVRTYAASVILISINFFAYMPLSYLMNFYLQNQLQYSVLKAGLTIGISSLVSFFASPIMGLILKKTSGRVTAFIAIVCIALGDFLFVFMNSSNNIKIIHIAFIIAGLGIGATSSLYQTAFENIPKNKNGIASGILNSVRQVVACIAIAFVSTLSSHFAVAAANSTKTQILNRVNSSVVLSQNIKTTITNHINTAKLNSTSTFSKDQLAKSIENNEKQVLKGVPENMQGTVKERFNTQKNEIYKIVDYAKTTKDNETIKIYNKCFLIIGIITAFGLIVVPFNCKKEEADDVEENLKQNA